MIDQLLSRLLTWMLLSVQLSGWTSDLVDIIMSHHFSAVSLSFTISLFMCFDLSH